MKSTTVKIHKSTKFALDDLKKENESYDEIIGRLVSQEKNKGLKEELINAYKELGKEDLRLLEEWEAASKEIDENE